MPKKIVQKITLFKDGTYDANRGPDCDEGTRRRGAKKEKKKSTKKKPRGT